jgi:hypothetical protein
MRENNPKPKPFFKLTHYPRFIQMDTTSKRIICTLFDHRYLPRGLCMIASVRANGGNQPIWVLCLSAACEQVL